METGGHGELPQHLIGNEEAGYNNQSCEKRRLEELEQIGPQRFRQRDRVVWPARSTAREPAS
jgi:hypothetical protein